MCCALCRWGEKWQDVGVGGIDADKIEVVLILKVPTLWLQDVHRRVPGRPDAFIIPKEQLHFEDGHHWLPKERVVRSYQLSPSDEDASALVLAAAAAAAESSNQESAPPPHAAGPEAAVVVSVPAEIYYETAPDVPGQTPVNESGLKALLDLNVLHGGIEAKVWWEGINKSDEWQPLREVADYFPSIGGGGGAFYETNPGEPSDEVGVGAIRAAAETGEISMSTSVWTEGMEGWQPLSECAEWFGVRIGVEE